MVFLGALLLTELAVFTAASLTHYDHVKLQDTLADEALPRDTLM